MCTFRACVPAAFPLGVSEMLSQHAEPPFKEAFSLQDVLPMSVAALGTLIAKETRHINKKCLH